MTEKETPKVSVCMITYNHEPYIAQAIEGVLMQETDFPYELVIGEDCSTDNTRKICEEYAIRYPDKIRLFAREQNLGISRNFIETLKACNGEYIALCEGDDYWTDPGKLQKQVQFLEQNDDFSCVFHNATVLRCGERDGKSSKLTLWDRDELTFDDVLWRRTMIGTATILLRAEVLKSAREALPFYDWVIHLLAAKHGRIRYIDDSMSVYRVHEGGWTNDFSLPKAKEFVRMTEACLTFFGKEYEEDFRFWLGHCYADVCFTSFFVNEANEFHLAFKECRRLWAYIPRRKQAALLIRNVAMRSRRLHQLYIAVNRT